MSSGFGTAALGVHVALFFQLTRGSLYWRLGFAPSCEGRTHRDGGTGARDGVRPDGDDKAGTRGRSHRARHIVRARAASRHAPQDARRGARRRRSGGGPPSRCDGALCRRANSPFFHPHSGSQRPHAGLMHHTLAAGIAGFSSAPGLGLLGAEPPRLGA